MSTGDSKQRARVLKEMLETEQAYTEDLMTLVNTFIMPLKLATIISPQDISNVFGNVNQIKLVNVELIKGLQSVIKLPEERQNLGEVFLHLADYFKMYTSYCTSSSNALMTAERLRKENNDFRKFLITQEKSPECKGLQLNSFLIKPVQRICKYPLLLREYLKYLPEQHMDHNKMVQSLQRIEEVVSAINEANRKAESFRNLDRTQKSLILPDGGSMKLLDAGRKFILDGDCAERGKQYHYYLLSDMLLLATPINKKKHTGKYLLEGQFGYELLYCTRLPNATVKLGSIDGAVDYVLRLNSDDEAAAFTVALNHAIVDTTEAGKQGGVDMYRMGTQTGIVRGKVNTKYEIGVLEQANESAGKDAERVRGDVRALLARYQQIMNTMRENEEKMVDFQLHKAMEEVQLAFTKKWKNLQRYHRMMSGFRVIQTEEICRAYREKFAAKALDVEGITLEGDSHDSALWEPVIEPGMADKVQQLISLASKYDIPTTPLEFVFVGAKGVGKTSLIESLIGVRLFPTVTSTAIPMHLHLHYDGGVEGMIFKSSVDGEAPSEMTLNDLQNHLLGVTRVGSETEVHVHIYSKHVVECVLIDTPGVKVKEEAAPLVTNRTRRTKSIVEIKATKPVKVKSGTPRVDGNYAAYQTLRKSSRVIIAVDELTDADHIPGMLRKQAISKMILGIDPTLQRTIFVNSKSTLLLDVLEPREVRHHFVAREDARIRAQSILVSIPNNASRELVANDARFRHLVRVCDRNLSDQLTRLDYHIHEDLPIPGIRALSQMMLGMAERHLHAEYRTHFPKQMEGRVIKVREERDMIAANHQLVQACMKGQAMEVRLVMEQMRQIVVKYYWEGMYGRVPSSCIPASLLRTKENPKFRRLHVRWSSPVWKQGPTNGMSQLRLLLDTFQQCVSEVEVRIPDDIRVMCDNDPMRGMALLRIHISDTFKALTRALVGELIHRVERIHSVVLGSIPTLAERYIPIRAGKPLAQQFVDAIEAYTEERLVLIRESMEDRLSGAMVVLPEHLDPGAARGEDEQVIDWAKRLCREMVQEVSMDIKLRLIDRWLLPCVEDRATLHGIVGDVAASTPVGEIVEYLYLPKVRVDVERELGTVAGELAALEADCKHINGLVA